jgi:hypothetical protein
LLPLSPQDVRIRKSENPNGKSADDFIDPILSGLAAML